MNSERSAATGAVVALGFAAQCVEAAYADVGQRLWVPVAYFGQPGNALQASSNGWDPQPPAEFADSPRQPRTTVSACSHSEADTSNSFRMAVKRRSFTIHAE